MDEATLRKLTRVKLQKLAKVCISFSFMKSETIIQELLKLYEVVQSQQDEGSEEPPRKRLRTSVQDQPPSGSRASEDIPPVAGPSTPIVDVPVDTSLDNPPTQKDSQKSALSTEKSALIAVARDAADVAAVNSAAILQGPSPVPESHTGHPAPDDDTNDTDSYLSYPSQHDSHRNSRSGTPPLETTQMLNWTVSIMNQVTSGDRRVLAQAAALRNRAKMFTYWREISPTWPTGWIYDDEEE